MFSTLRYCLPEVVNTNVMYFFGRVRCFSQYYFDNTFSASAITDRLFVGDLASASNKDAMKDQGITHIVSVYNGTYAIFAEDFKYELIHVNDDWWVDIEKHFDQSIQFIEEALKDPQVKVMVQCQRGASRSVTILLAYMLYKMNEDKKIPKEDIDNVIKSTLAHVKEHRSIADPNEGFVKSLKTYIYRLNDYSNDSEEKSKTKTETETVTV